MDSYTPATGARVKRQIPCRPAAALATPESASRERAVAPAQLRLLPIPLLGCPSGSLHSPARRHPSPQLCLTGRCTEGSPATAPSCSVGSWASEQSTSPCPDVASAADSGRPAKRQRLLAQSTATTFKLYPASSPAPYSTTAPSPADADGAEGDEAGTLCCLRAPRLPTRRSLFGEPPAPREEVEDFFQAVENQIRVDFAGKWGFDVATDSGAAQYHWEYAAEERWEQAKQA